MKFKKTLLSLVSIAAVAAPVATVVACGNRTGGLSAMGWALKLSPNAKVWFVADGGKVTDRSFNESALAGVAEYGFKSDTTYNLVEPNSEGEIAKGYDSAVNQGAKVIVGAGFNHGAPAHNYFNKNKTTTFIGIDNDFVKVFGTSVANDDDRKNLASIIFPTEQAGYLAGVYAVEYIATHKTEFDADKSGTTNIYKVAAFGGGKFGAVTSWMDGFRHGVEVASNSIDKTKNDIKVEMVFADGSKPSAKDFTTDSFTPDSTQVGPIVKEYLRQGADIIFPVAGPQIKKTIDEIRLEGKKAKVIGVDGDQRAALGAAYKDLIIGSAVKSLQLETKIALQKFFDKAHPDDFKNEYIMKPHSGSIGFVPMTKEEYVNADFGHLYSENPFSSSASFEDYKTIDITKIAHEFGDVK